MARTDWKITAWFFGATIVVSMFILYPLGKVFGATNLTHFFDCLTTSYFIKPLWNSVMLGATVALAGTLIGFLLAYAVERSRIRGAAFFDTLCTIPVVAPPFLVAMAAIMLFGRNGIVVKHVLGGKELFSVYGFWGLFITETLAYFPTALLVLKGTMRAMHFTYQDAARSLGATRWQTFVRVTLPLAIPGITSSLLLIFIESLADFGNPLILSGSYQVLSVQAYLQMTAIYDIPGSAALSIMLLAPSLLVFVIHKYVVSRKVVTTITGKSGASRASSGLGSSILGYGVCTAISASVILFYGMILVGAVTKLWGVDASFVFSNFAKGMQMGWQYVLRSVAIALASAPITGMLGMMIAYLVIRTKIPGRSLLEFSSLLAFAVPGTIIGIGYILAFKEPHWFLPVTLQGTGWIILALFIFRNMPVGLQSATSGLAQIDKTLEEAARSLGASPTLVFRRIVLPLLMPAFISGAIYSFVRAMTQISAVIFVVSGKWNLLTVFLLGLVENGELSIAAAVGVVLVLIVLLALGILKFLVHRWQVRSLVKAVWI
ncbi:MAG: iron ABC transporter permease [Deltaproteobacteria bacterium]|nr:iron ABC transporter permease [Deltaproteobacteria bacterium]